MSTTLLLSQRMPHDLQEIRTCLWLGGHEDADEKMRAVRVDAGIFARHQTFCERLRALMYLERVGGVHDEDAWKAYVAVNDAFGKDALDIMKTTSIDVVWLHDHQLMMAAVAIREYLVENCGKTPCKLGFFMHVPFPPWDVFQNCPHFKDLLQGVLACDAVGFYTDVYCRNFLECCRRGLGCRVDGQRLLVEHRGGTVAVMTLSASNIPFQRACNKKVAVTFDDRLESVLVKLDALKMLAEDCPIAMLFVVVDVDETRVQHEIDQVEGATCTYGCKNELELLRTADVCLVTPLNNGFSPLAADYVALQDGDVPGVLLVSSTSGNADAMPEAVAVNASSPAELALGLRRAFAMPKYERTVRMKAMRARLQRARHWRTTFLRGDPDVMPREDFDVRFSQWRPARDVVVLLDYDGTLAPLQPRPELAVMPEDTRSILRRLSRAEGCHVAVISGRGIGNVAEMVDISGVTYAGSHGLEIVFPDDGEHFAFSVSDDLRQRVEELHALLQGRLCRDGAWIENKRTSLTFHYSDGPVEYRKALEGAAGLLIEKAGFKSERGHLAVEAKPHVEWNKGRAALYVLEKKYGSEWVDKVNVIYAGDDVTDEDAMRLLKGMAVTVKVTSSTMTDTCADFRVPNPQAIYEMLKWIEQYLNRR